MNIHFYSEGSRIAAELYLPPNYDETQTYPAVQLCHGFAGIKELLLPPFAEAFANAGYIALTFDYRGFGESKGETRIDPLNQIQDIYHASQYLRSLPQVNNQRIFLWGTSLGGANCIIAAAMDSAYRALSVQLTFGNGERVVTQGNPQIKEKSEAMITKLWNREILKNSVMMVPITKMLDDEQSQQFIKQYSAEHPKVITDIPFGTLKNTYRMKAEKFIDRIEAPILIIGAENDQVNPVSESKILYQKAIEPKSLLLLKNCSHYDAYSREFEKIFTAQLQFFNRYL